jgi:hypothetical protein
MSTISGYFERAYVVNLPQRTDRLHQMRQQLKAIGLRLGEGNVVLFPAIRPACKGEFESVGARGCFLSHLGCLEHAVRDSCARIAIFEDDLTFTQDFNARIDTLVRQLARMPWRIFYGGHRISGAAPRSPASGLWPVPADIEVATTHFVAFQGAAIEGAANLLKALADRPAGDPAGGAMHVDGAYNWYRRLNPADLTLAAVPELGYQRSSRTDVHPLGRLDRTPLIRDAVSRLRDLKNRVVSKRSRCG